ncbi:MAG: hypothetical protein HC824_05755 [Synechococcales cyanobacterium RM1_1_8]|nr:hypothetical protein [Synechococcales cyanobacterium RM1_1_8]
MTPAQQALIQEALAIAPNVTLGEAYRHVSASAVLEDFSRRLEPLDLSHGSPSLAALKALAGNGQPSEADWRRFLALCKLIVRVQKTRDRLSKDHWLTQRQAAQARRS